MKTNFCSSFRRPASRCRLILAGSVLTLLGGAFAATSAQAQSTVGAYSYSGVLPAADQTANVGLSLSKTYLELIDLGDTGNRVVNGVTFTGNASLAPSGSGLLAGTSYSLTGPNNIYTAGGTVPAGQVGGLTNNFIYGGNPAVLTLNGLTVGQTYSISFYDRSFGAGGRGETFVASGASTSAATVIDEDGGASGQGQLSIIRYTFQASSASQVLTITPVNAANTFHLYDFATEQTFNNTYVSGSNYSTASFLNQATNTTIQGPNGIGSNASFGTAASPTTITLDVAETLGHLQFQGANAYTFGGSQTLTLQADPGAISVLSSLSGTHNIAVPVVLATDTMKVGAGALNISGAISGTGGLNVSGGVLNLQNAETYTGVTTVSGGRLNLGAGSSLTSPVTVLSGGTFGTAQAASGGTSTVGGALTQSAGGALNLQDGFTSTVSVTGNTTLTGGTNSTLAFDVSGNTNASDTLTIGGTATASGAETVSISTFGATAPAATSFTLISGGAASTLNNATYTLAGGGRLVFGTTAYASSLSATATALTLTLGASGAASAYWSGDQSANWSTNNAGNTNFAKDIGNAVDLGALPTFLQDVIFSTTGATNLTNSLGSNFTVNSLNFNSTTGAVTINPGGAFSLTLNNGLTNASGVAQTVNAPVILGSAQTWTNSGSGLVTVGGGVTAGTNLLTIAGAGSFAITGATAFTTSAGFTVNSGTGAFTISAPVTLGAAQTWTNNSTNAVTVSGPVTTGANLLTIAGSGSIAVTGTLTPSAGITVNGGTGAFTASGPIALTAAQTFTNNSSNVATFGSSTNAISGTNTNLTISGSGPVTLAGALTTGSGTLSMTGSNILTVSGTNTNTGNLLIFSGTVRPGSATAFTNKSRLDLASGATFDVNGFTPVFTDSSLPTGAIITNNGAALGTLSLSATGGLVLNGRLQDGTSPLAVAISNNNSGVQIFPTANQNTFSGGLTLLTNGGTGTRLRIQTAITTTGPAGAIVSGPFGRGAITIGLAPTDKAGILVDSLAGGITLANDIVFNTALGNDVVGFRFDTSGSILSGKITANLANATFATGTTNTGTASLTGQVTGPKGLSLTGATSGSFTLTLNNTTANLNNYVGDTTLAIRNTLVLGAANQIPDGAGKGNVVDNGTLNLNGLNETVNGLSGTGIVDGTSGSPTLTVGGADATASFGGVLQNTAGTLNLVKTGLGVQTLTGVNTLSGTITVNAGGLALSGSGSLANITGLTIAGGGRFSYLPATVGTQPVTGPLTLAGGSNLSLAFGSTVAATGAATVGGAVNLALSGNFTSGTPYTLLTAASGLNAAGASYPVFNPTNFTYTETVSAGSVVVTPTSATPLASAYWVGGLAGNPKVWAASSGTASNWASDAAGTPTGLVPGAGTNVFFALNTANQTGMTLGADMAINSLTVNGTVNTPNDTAPLSLDNFGGATLTIGATGSTTAGLTINAGSGAVTLNPPLALGASQTWRNDSGNLLSVNGAVSEGASSLTLAGSGPMTLSGVISGAGAIVTALGGGPTGINNTATGVVRLTGLNTYTGETHFGPNSVTNVSSLSDYGQPSALGSRVSDAAGSQVGLVFDGGTLQYTGATPQSTNRAIRVNAAGGAFIDASGSVPTATLSFTAATSPDFFVSAGTRQLTFTGSNTGNNTFNIAIVNQAGNATTVNKTGLGKWVLTGTGSNYTGPTTVTGGTLAASATGSLGATTTIAVSNSGTLLLTGTGFAPAAASVTLGENTGNTTGTLAFGPGSTAATAFSQTFASLTLNANSTLDFGTGDNATFSLTTLTLGGFLLAVDHFSGTASYTSASTAENGSNTDRLLTSSVFTDAQLTGVSFFNDSHTLIATGGHQISYAGPSGTLYEIVPIPEPSTLYSALLAAGLVGLRERRRLRRLIGSRG